MAKFIFHRDRFGVYIYYPKSNADAINETRHHYLMLNGIHELNFKISAVVPPVTRISSVCDDGTILVHEFEIVDITYPADDRMVPLRHYTDNVNYFEINCTEVCSKFIDRMASNFGLIRFGNPKRGQYDYSDRFDILVTSMNIEGKRYNITYNVKVSRTFTGDLEECRDHINKIEASIRAAFDEWRVNDMKLSHLTTDLVVTHLDRIYKLTKAIDPKIRTLGHYNNALRAIQDARREVLDAQAEELNDKEEFDRENLTSPNFGV